MTTAIAEEEVRGTIFAKLLLGMCCVYVILTLLFFSFFFKSLLSNGERRRMLRILKVEWGGRSDGLIENFCRDYLSWKELCNSDRWKKLRRTAWRTLKVSNERDWISSKYYFQSSFGLVEKDKEVRGKENVQDKYLKRHLEELKLKILWTQIKRNCFPTNFKFLYIQVFPCIQFSIL